MGEKDGENIVFAYEPGTPARAKFSGTGTTSSPQTTRVLDAASATDVVSH